MPVDPQKRAVEGGGGLTIYSSAPDAPNAKTIGNSGPTGGAFATPDAEAAVRERHEEPRLTPLQREGLNARQAAFDELDAARKATGSQLTQRLAGAIVYAIVDLADAVRESR